MDELLKSIEGMEPSKALAIVLEKLESKANQWEEIMDIDTLSRYLKVKKTWVYKRVQFKEIPFSKVGKYPRFRKKDIDAWFEDQSSVRARA